LGIEVDVPPLPIGAAAEGSARPGLGRHRRKPGRQGVRGTACASRAMRHAPWWRGKASAVPALKPALVELATRLG
jgi:hypothetical protein